MHYHVVGMRADGSRIVLLSTSDPHHAEKRRAQFARMLEGYGAIAVEADGTTHPPEEAMRQTTSSEENGTPTRARRLPTPGGEGEQAAPLGRTERIDAVCRLLEELPPGTKPAAVVQEAAKRGLDILPRQVYSAIQKLARGSSPRRKPRLKRAPVQASAPAHEPATPSGELFVPAGAIGPFLAACHKLGGFRAAQQVLNEVATQEGGQC